MRLLALTLPFVGLCFVTACGDTYNDAELACQGSFELENACRAAAGAETISISKEQQCASAVSAVGDDPAAIEAKAADFDCSTDAWTAADCSTQAGLQAAADAATDCFF